MTLKQVKMICAICNQMGVAQVDTTESVLVMVCLCPNCSTYKKEQEKDEMQTSLAEMIG